MLIERSRTQPYAQFLLAAASLIVILVLGTIDSERVTPLLLAGFGVIVLSTAAMTAVWLVQPTHHTEWLAIVPLVQIIACVPLRDAGTDVLPSAAMLIIFPLGWLAFAFPPMVTAAGVLLTAVGPLVQALSSGGFDSASDIVSVVALPVISALVAVTVSLVARDLARMRATMHSVSTELDQALRLSDRDTAMLRATLDATDNAVAVFGPDGRPILLNAVAAEISGRSGIDDVDRDGFASLIWRADPSMPVEATSADFVERVRSGDFAAPRTVEFGGDPRRVMQVIVRPVVAGGDEVGIVIVGQDVTDLVNAVEVRDRFLSTVGHEFRTPLTVILGHTDIALMNNSAETERWEAVERSAERLLRLVERLITAGQTSRDVEARSGASHVGPVVKHAVTEVAVRAMERGIGIQIGTMPERAARIAVRDLSSILEELLRNAVEFTPAGGGDIVVSAHEDGRDIVVTVADQGIGMTEQERVHAFERFYRAPYAHEEAIPGTGIGLSNAASLADAYGASVSLQAHNPRGTLAVLRLPS
ncbi:sensor histidine kinase [Microbacterium oleivorans]|uniref:histidine kinase n=1 Tax=Microbacterium oleivorans TaxID=273677 RepID=A0A031FNX2_9MICO|nr:sensor histidine kinase [Microbacterium oleivorans]EZP26263.1 putative signal transduction histidine kinase [Microbacterium oleivorans]